jgi:hypothetical protein
MSPAENRFGASQHRTPIPAEKVGKPDVAAIFAGLRGFPA